MTDRRRIVMKGVPVFVDRKGNLYSPHTGRKYKLHPVGNGYLGTRVSWRGVQPNILAHRAVALTFVKGKTAERDCVNHIDGDKFNNAVDNLEWLSHLENIRHAHALGLCNSRKAVLGTREETGEMLYLDGIVEAKKFGLGPRNICNALKGWTRTAYGYTWKYLNKEHAT